MKAMRKIIPALLVALLVTVLVNLASASSAADPAQLIAGLDGVVGIEAVPQNEVDENGEPQFCYRYKYVVTFRQPLDWNDPSAGTFDQRVLVGINDLSAPNVAETQGYFIPEKKFGNDPRLDLEKILDGNYFEIEHRFFGGSKPEGLSNDDTALWEYLTTYNAASDQNRIISELKKVFTGKWVSTGRSKGGLTANMLSMYYPDAVDLTVSCVAPLCDQIDGRFYRFTYEEASSALYGEKERDLMTDFQIEALIRRDELMPLFKAYMEEEKATFRAQATDDVLFDVCVLETAVATWQYAQEFDKVESCLAMPENTDDEKTEKLKAMMEIIKIAGLEVDTSSPHFPYFVQAGKELGNYFYDFSFLRQALRDRGMDPDAYLAVREDHVYSAADLVLTDAQKEAFRYDGMMNERLKEWAETTDSRVIMIYGSSDPWYSVRVPDTENPNVSIFVSDRKPHTARILNTGEDDLSFEEQEQEQIIRTIKEAMGM